MIEAIMIGLAVALGVPWLIVGLLVVSLVQPWIGLVSVFGWLTFCRERGVAWSADIRFCRGVADELRGGASLRQALESAANEINETSLARACRIGRPFEEVASAVEVVLPNVGSAAASAIRIAGESGGRVADSFEAIAFLAADEQEMRDERRAATAQVRASAGVIAALPVVLLVLLAATGRVSSFTAVGSLSMTFVAGGLILIVVGLWLIWRMMRRAEVAAP